VIFYKLESPKTSIRWINNGILAGFPKSSSKSYNGDMSDQYPFSSGDLGSLEASIQRLTEKIAQVVAAVQKLAADRVQLEEKIEDAQKRIQHILSRLPEQTDGRQMNLLGESSTPEPEDGNEPTTH